MLSDYAEELADGSDLNADGDMLLLQWCTHDWRHGPVFEGSIVRHLIVADDEEAEPRQLILRIRFKPAAGSVAGGGTGKWCASPDKLDAFRRYVAGSPALATVGQRSPESVELRYGRT
jgi:hypothetical protein